MITNKQNHMISTLHNQSHSRHLRRIPLPWSRRRNHLDLLLLLWGLSPAPPTFAPLPDARRSSSLSPPACSPSSHFLFDAGFSAACSFDNSGRKHFCFLPEHSLHATPVGVRPGGTPRATASFHLLIRAGSTQQQDLRPAHPPHRAGPSRSSSSGAFAFAFPFLGEAPSLTSMVSLGW